MKLNYSLNSGKKIALLLVILVFVDCILHFKSYRHPPSIPAPTVAVQKPQLMNITEYVMQTGVTVAYNAVDLVARIEGFLETISFIDGTFVNKGQPLFVIEPKPYFEKLKGAEASVSAQKANAVYTKSEYERQKKMFKQNATSLNNVEKWFAQSEIAKSEVEKAGAQAEIATINYSYTHVSAPFTGRMGRHLVDIGNLVGNGVATKLATIEQISPLYVYFNLNELDLVRLREAFVSQGYSLKKTPKVPVSITLQNQGDEPYEATLDFINTGLNASTGTLELRAILPNKDFALIPGLFVEVRIPISSPTPQLTVPNSAILYDQVGNYVLTVDDENIVQLKHVTLGGLEKGQRAILKGITKNDRVIVSGFHNASPGHLVTPQAKV